MNRKILNLFFIILIFTFLNLMEGAKAIYYCTYNDGGMPGVASYLLSQCHTTSCGSTCTACLTCAESCYTTIYRYDCVTPYHCENAVASATNCGSDSCSNSCTASVKGCNSEGCTSTPSYCSSSQYCSGGSCVSGDCNTDVCTGTCGTGTNSCVWRDYGCNSGSCDYTDYNVDTTQARCTSCKGASYWNSTTSVKYDTGTNPSCCGDDANENKITRSCSPGVCTSDATDWGCCNATTKCVYNGTCYDNNYVGDVDSDTISEKCVNNIWQSTTAPNWGNVSQNSIYSTSNLPKLLSVQWYSESGLSKAILSTNETGVWKNITTTYNSPTDMSGTQYWSNFTWSNSSITNRAVIQWKVYANDTSNIQAVTDTFSFVVNYPTVCWSNITKTFVSGDQDKTISWRIYANDSYSSWNVTSIQTFRVVLLCEPPTSGDWTVAAGTTCTCDGKTWTVNNGNAFIYGTLAMTNGCNITFTSLNKNIYVYSNASVQVSSNSGFNKPS